MAGEIQQRRDAAAQARGYRNLWDQTRTRRYYRRITNTPSNAKVDDVEARRLWQAFTQVRAAGPGQLQSSDIRPLLPPDMTDTEYLNFLRSLYGQPPLPS